MAQIEIKNLTFKYAMADSSCLKNVSLNIENGDFVVVCWKIRLWKDDIAQNV